MRKFVYLLFLVAIVICRPHKAYGLVNCTQSCAGVSASCQDTDIEFTRYEQDKSNKNSIIVEAKIVHGPLDRKLCIVVNQQPILNVDTQQNELGGDFCEIVDFGVNGISRSIFNVNSAKGYDFSIITNPYQPAQCSRNVQVSIQNLSTPTPIPTQSATCLNTVGSNCGDKYPPPCPNYYCDKGVSGNAPFPKIIAGFPTPTGNVNFEGDQETVNTAFNKINEGCGRNGQICCQASSSFPKIDPMKYLDGGDESFVLDRVKQGVSSLTNSLMSLSDNSALESAKIVNSGGLCIESPSLIKYKTNLNSTIREANGRSTVLDLNLSKDEKITECACYGKSSNYGLNNTFDDNPLCNYIPHKEITDTEFYNCSVCSKHGVYTSLGCIEYDVEPFVNNFIFKYGIGLAGIFSLMCIGYASFTIQTSVNNPEKIKHAQDLMTSCITGLLLVIFSVFILRIIGVDLLQIPGFGK